ncbi:MAG TPA: endonuclease domain-containing protein [Caulobacteraceae bacterium]|nr:endonuclease domain-containing protein [Caulobacteraceae bacterium]
MSYTQPLHRSVERARLLRKELTPPEARLWMALRRRGVANLRFRRQHPIGPFIVDFFCPSARLVVEVDGQIHTLENSPMRDDRRDLWLENHGLTVLRIPAMYVRDNLDAVLREIAAAAERAMAR